MLEFFKSQHETYGAISETYLKQEDTLSNTDLFLFYIKNVSNITITLDSICAKSNLNYKIKFLSAIEREIIEFNSSYIGSLDFISSYLDINEELPSQQSVAVAIKYFDSDFNKTKNKLIIEVEYL